MEAKTKTIGQFRTRESDTDSADIHIALLTVVDRCHLPDCLQNTSESRHRTAAQKLRLRS